MAQGRYAELRRAVLEAGLLDRAYGYYVWRTSLSFLLLGVGVALPFLLQPLPLGQPCLGTPVQVTRRPLRPGALIEQVEQQIVRQVGKDSGYSRCRHVAHRTVPVVARPDPYFARAVIR